MAGRFFKIIMMNYDFINANLKNHKNLRLTRCRGKSSSPVIHIAADLTILYQTNPLFLS